MLLITPDNDVFEAQSVMAQHFHSYEGMTSEIVSNRTIKTNYTRTI
jgi:hypothetical protein